MRGAALSDLHLGFNAFPATIDGRNAREQDVERAWRAAVEQVVAAGPDLVTLAGDIFHHPRVSDHAKRAFLEGVVLMLEATDASVVVLQGNHDAGRTAAVLTPIALAQPLASDRLHIVTTPRRIQVWAARSEETVSVACFPFVARGDGATYRLEPDPEADVNVLLLHAAVHGAAEGDRLPYFYGGDQALDVGREADRWDVIACGDYHEFTRLHPSRLAFYSGSIERTSSNIWQEELPKGWVLYDTVAGTLDVRAVPTRPMRDFSFRDFHTVEPVCAQGVNAALRDLADPKVSERIAGAIVRLMVPDFPREDRDQIDWQLVRQLKHTCLHFYLDVRYRAHEAADLGDRRERGRALSLADEAAAFFAPDPEDVRALAARYLDIQAALEDAEEPELQEVGS